MTHPTGARTNESYSVSEVSVNDSGTVRGRTYNVTHSPSGRKDKRT